MTKFFEYKLYSDREALIGILVACMMADSFYFNVCEDIDKLMAILKCNIGMENISQDLNYL